MRPFDAAWQLLKRQISILSGKPLGTAGLYGKAGSQADYDSLLANYHKETGYKPRSIKPDFSNVGVRKVPTTEQGMQIQHRSHSGVRPVTDIYEPYMLDTGERLGEMTVYDDNKVGISSIDSDVRRQGLYDKLFRTALQDKGSLSSTQRSGKQSTPFHEKLQQSLPQSMSSVTPQGPTFMPSIDYTLPTPPENWGSLQYDVGGLPLMGVQQPPPPPQPGSLQAQGSQ